MKRPNVQESYLARFFAFLTNFFYAALSVGVLGRIFTSYHRVDRKFRASATGRLLNTSEHSGGKLRRTIRRNIALAMEKSFLIRGVSGFWRLLCDCSLRTVGAFFLTTGTYSALLYCLFAFVWGSSAIHVGNLFWGIGFFVVGVILMFSETSLGYALTKSFFFGKLFVSGLGISEGAVYNAEPVGQKGYVVAVPLGMALGALCALTSPLYLLIGFAFLLLCLMVLAVPESGAVLMILFMPFVGFMPKKEMWIVLLVALPSVAYIGKLLRGNRAFHVEVQDLPALLMLILFLLSAFSVAGGKALGGSLLAALVMCGYFLTVNVVATPRWVNRCRVVLITSAAASALIGIAQFFITVFTMRGMRFVDVAMTVTAGFDDRVTFAYYLVVVFPFALVAFAADKNRQRLLTGLSLLAMLTGAVVAWVPSAIVAMVMMVLVFLLLYVRRSFPFVLVGGALSPLVASLIPTAASGAALRLIRSASGKRAEVSDVVSRIFFENGSGIFSRGAGFSRLLFGLGQGGPERFFVLYTPIAAEQLALSVNFWVYRLLEGGVLGVLLPAAFFFLMYQSCFSLLCRDKDRRFVYSALVGIMMITGVLIMSFFHYTWHDPTALALFFIAAGLIAADARIERSHDVELPTDERDGRFAAELDYYGRG